MYVRVISKGCSALDVLHRIDSQPIYLLVLQISNAGFRRSVNSCKVASSQRSVHGSLIYLHIDIEHRYILCFNPNYLQVQAR